MTSIKEQIEALENEIRLLKSKTGWNMEECIRSPEGHYVQFCYLYDNGERVSGSVITVSNINRSGAITEGALLVCRLSEA